MDWQGNTPDFLIILSNNRDRLTEDEAVKFHKKHMVETSEQALLGIAHGAFTEDGCICLKNITYHTYLCSSSF